MKFKSLDVKRCLAGQIAEVESDEEEGSQDAESATGKEEFCFCWGGCPITSAMQHHVCMFIRLI